MNEIRKENILKTRQALEGNRFICSYSGGKDSALALYRAIQAGGIPQQLIMTYNIDAGRTWFHGVPEQIIRRVEEAMEIPIQRMCTRGEEYGVRLEEEFRAQKKQGADVCIFGDIDLDEHLAWCMEHCAHAGITGLFPLWKEARDQLVYEFIDYGFTAHITVLNTEKMSERFLGAKLTREVVDAIRAEGADICGENGEYHSFVSDGPVFRKPVRYSFGRPIRQGVYAIMPLEG